MSSWLSDCNFKLHVANDIGTDEQFIAAKHLKRQEHLNDIAKLTTDNKMKLNEKKSNYMVFSRSSTEIATRLTLNDLTLDRIEEVKILGLWVTTWLDWEKNTREVCKKAYARMPMLTKLKYVGVGKDDLLDIYIPYLNTVLLCGTLH